MSVHASKGFTLFELLITVVIIAMITAMAMPAFQQMQINGHVSSLSGEIVQAISEARSRAVATRTAMIILQGPGANATDVATVTAGDWSTGWRILQGPSGAPTLQSRNDKSLAGDKAIGKTAVKMNVTNGSVDMAGTATGTAINGFGFDVFGRLTAADGTTPLTQLSIVICAPNASNERGRAIGVSAMGRITNNVVTDPASC